MRKVFDGFDFHRAARFDETRVAALLQDAGIVRHRGKIEAVTNSARHAVALREESGSLGAYFWRYEIDPAKAAPPQTASVAEESIALARAGFGVPVVECSPSACLGWSRRKEGLP